MAKLLLVVAVALGLLFYFFYLSPKNRYEQSVADAAAACPLSAETCACITAFTREHIPWTVEMPIFGGMSAADLDALSDRAAQACG